MAFRMNRVAVTLRPHPTSVQARSDSGAESGSESGSATAVAGSAEVTRYSSARRLGRAGAVALGGVVLGGLSILIPGLHLISTWLLPLLGIGVAGWLLSVHARVGLVEGTCPSCGQAMRIEGTGHVGSEAVWVRCNHCQHPLELVIPAG